MSVRRMLPFILINILVSAVVVLAILYWWDNRDTEQVETAAATVAAPIIPVATAVPETLPQGTAETVQTDDRPLIHIVKAGDTLGSISQFYDVTLEDLMTANDIANPNIISVGQQLAIPVGGIPTATPAPAATATPNLPPTPIPTEPLGEGQAIIEIVDVIGVDQLAEEAVQIINSGSRQVALAGWKLADGGGHVYTFGLVTIFGDGAGVLVHTEAGQDTPTDLYWGLEEPVWESGELVTLLDSEETIQATFEVP